LLYQLSYAPTFRNRVLRSPNPSDIRLLWGQIEPSQLCQQRLSMYVNKILPDTIEGPDPEVRAMLSSI
jgi:hypothetical protein